MLLRFGAMATDVDATLKTRRWTRAEYDRLVELGVFEGERLELLAGVLAVREPQGSRHSAAIRAVLDALRSALGHAWQIDSQLPIALDDDSEPEPDVAVVPRDAERYRRGHPGRPALIVEVAESSYRIDHSYKASLYARAGVPEYWLVDVVRETVEVHRNPEASAEAIHGWRYGSVETLRPPATITPMIAPHAAIAVADLLP
jgi:Uma2 family endonuclease